VCSTSELYVPQYPQYSSDVAQQKNGIKKKDEPQGNVIPRRQPVRSRASPLLSGLSGLIIQSSLNRVYSLYWEFLQFHVVARARPRGIHSLARVEDHRPVEELPLNTAALLSVGLLQVHARVGECSRCHLETEAGSGLWLFWGVSGRRKRRGVGGRSCDIS